MQEIGREETFRDLVQRPNIMAFMQQLILQSYTECAGDHAAEMETLLNTTFQLLVENAADPDRFDQAMQTIPLDVFKKQDPDFWFNQLYTDYKRLLKPRFRYEKMRAWLKGPRLLDFGCGDGRLSSLLTGKGFQVSMCDVLDYRDELTAGLPFQQMVDTRRVPYPDHSFDTALIMAVLHHIEAGDLLPLLDDLRRVAGRLIVEEDSYDLPANLDGLAEVLKNDHQLSRFMGMSLEDQFRCLMFIDTFGNVLAQGLAEMDFPFNFKTVNEWRDLFTSQGWRITRILPMGFQANQFNRSCHIWFILD